jgi:hypothetical protein
MARVRVAGLVAILLSTLTASPAHAEGGTAAYCSIAVPVHFSPGVSATSTSGTVTTGGEAGSISCTGAFEGHRVTGTGSFGYEGVFTNITCLLDGTPLSARYSFTVPTETGTRRFTGTITDARIGIVDRIDLSQRGATFAGIALIAPARGDCLVTPMTDVVVTMIGSFKG